MRSGYTIIRPVRSRALQKPVVSRTEVSTLRGRVDVVDITYEVVLNREQPINRKSEQRLV